jgi:hypothetical protein
MAPRAALPYLDQRISVSETEVGLRAGQSVRIVKVPDLAGWTPKVGTWQIDNDGALVGTSAAEGLLIAFDARVGPDFEISTEIDVAATSNGQFQAGIVFGPDLTFASHRWSLPDQEDGARG